MLLLIYVRGCCDLEPAISVVMTLEPAWEVLSLGRVRLEAQPEHSHSHLHRWWKSTSFPRSSLAGTSLTFPRAARQVQQENIAGLHVLRKVKITDRHTAPNPVRTFYRTRGILEESSKRPPRNPEFAKKREKLKKNTVPMDREMYKKRDCALWQTLMKCHMREDDGKLSGKSSPSFLSPVVPGGWYYSWKNEFKVWASISQETQTNKRWGCAMVEIRQENKSHACGRSQGNSYKIATGNKPLFHFSTLNHLSSGGLKIILQNTHWAGRKI